MAVILAAFVLAAVLAPLPAAAQEDALEDIDVFLDEPAGGAAPEAAEPEALDDLDDLATDPGGRAGPAGASTEAGGLDDLDDLSTELEGAEELGGLTGEPRPAEAFEEQEEALSLSFNGYVKPLAVWEHRTFPAKFPVPDKNRFTTVGARTQLRLQGALRDDAQFFTAVNLDFNEVDRETDTVSEDSGNGKLRMVEAYVDLFGESTRWRLGSQLVTWSFMDGFEVPTDRLNARDFSFKSSELEDLKLASTGAQFSWRFARQKLDLFYIPVGKVNRLPPDFDRVFDQEETRGDTIQSADSKYAAQLSGTLARLDYAISYVDGRNPRPDLGEIENPGEDEPEFFKRYQRVQSPGLDLQLNLGSVLARLSAVYWDTEDLDNDDPLLQNDWWQAMIGVEFWLGSALVNFNLGRREVVDHNDDPDLDFENILLGQTAGTTNVVAGIVSDSYLTGNALEVSFLYAYLWNDESGELVALRVRPSISYNFGDGVSLTFIPSYSNEIGIETQEYYSEIKFSF